MPKKFQTLKAWLHWQEQLHPKTIELGLERVAAVWNKLHPASLTCPIITVGGTNGKGSCVAMLEAILQTYGYQVGLYSSPHLLRYNERIRINGIEVTDDALCQAFERIEHARAEISLTYFEFGTLAALDLFAEASVDAAILEVGLGGRLDAVNILNADVALVTTVDLDHTEWLGPNRDTIAKEKAGIFRTRHPAIIGDATPPLALLQCAWDVDAQIFQYGIDFKIQDNQQSWDWHSENFSLLNLPKPALRAIRQLDNAAAVLMVLNCLMQRLPVTREAICSGLTSVTLPGRLQVIPGSVTWILDVAHNPQAAYYLALDLANIPCAGCTHVVFACLADKDATGIIKALAPQIDTWHLAQLSGPRAHLVENLVHLLNKSVTNATKRTYQSVQDALQGAISVAKTGDRILVTGSFLTVAAALNGDLLIA